MGVNAVQRAVFRNQRQRALFADSADALDVVRRVAHDRLHVHELRGRDPVFGRNAGGVVNLRLAVGGKVHRDMRRNKLEAVAVAGDEHALVALALGGRGDGAEQVVGLVALAGDDGIAEQPADILGERKLDGQRVGHPLAVGLVGLARLMAEGRRRQVEGHRDGRRRDGVDVFQQDVDKAENRVGRQSVRRGERPHAVKGAVQDAVAVKNKYFLHVGLPFAASHFLILQYTTRAPFCQGKRTCGFMYLQTAALVL